MGVRQELYGELEIRLAGDIWRIKMIVSAPLNKEYISVLIPTINRGSIKTVLTNLCASEIVGEVIISDAGEISIMSDIDNIVLLDLLRRKGATVKIIREWQVGIGKTRYSLMQEAKNKIALFIDDDVYFNDINALYTILNVSQVPYIAPLCHITTDFLGVKGLNRNPISWQEAMKIADGRDWILPYFNIQDGINDVTLRINFCGTQCLMFKVEDGLRAIELKRWKKGFNREDIYLTKTMGQGLLCTHAVSWHLQTDQQYREWKNADEEIGYLNVINNRLEDYLE
jgi:glycosyltransferase involved in cell wall biosynthesis